MNDPDALLDGMMEHAEEMGVPGLISYTRMSVDTSPATKDVALLPLAKKRAIDPTVFDEIPPFFFGGEATNMRWDSYETRMGTSSLQNYAKDFATGVAYLVGHDNRATPVGGTLTGTFEQQSPSKATVRADVYMIQEPESMSLIQKIRAGIAKDQSIGFYMGENGAYICSICNRDMLDWWSNPDSCQHMLGMRYAPTDSKGKEKEGAAKVVARATIEDAHASELSNVYDGSTPGAMVDKARALASQGHLDHRMHELVQVRYKITLPSDKTVFPVAQIVERKADTAMTEEEIQALRDQVARLERDIAAHKRSIEAVRAVFAKGMVPTEFEGKEADETVSFLIAERSRLLPLADDGNRYRTDLVAAALEEGVRAMGAGFSKESYEAVLRSSPIDSIKRFRDDWAAMAKLVLPAGRQTQDPEEIDRAKKDSSAFTPKRAREAAAYGG